MTIAETLSYKRDPEHDYSAPGIYHLFFETENSAEILGKERNDVMTLNTFGEVFLAVLGMALQRLPCLRIKKMDIRPTKVEMVLEIMSQRRELTAAREDGEAWTLDRRHMTIPLFVGFTKMNSGSRINIIRSSWKMPVWTERYKVRLMTDEAEIQELCARLDASFGRVRLSKARERGGEALAAMVMRELGGMRGDQSSFGILPLTSADGFDTMLLGRAIFLSGSMLRPVPEESALAEGTSDHACVGGRAPVPLICSIGPGRILVSGSAQV